MGIVMIIILLLVEFVVGMIIAGVGITFIETAYEDWLVRKTASNETHRKG